MRTKNARPAQKSPPPKATSPATSDQDLRRFLAVGHALGLEPEQMLEQAQLDFARAWLEQLKGHLEVTVTPATTRSATPATRPTSLRAVQAPAQRSDLDLPRFKPKSKEAPVSARASTKDLKDGSAECSGCGGVAGRPYDCTVKWYAV